jgi:hypothetical protein
MVLDFVLICFFNFSFLQGVLHENIWRVNVLSRLWDVQITFGILF